MSMLLFFRPTSAGPNTIPANTAAPTISGAATVGSILTASPGTWSGSPAPTFSYQWQRDVAGNGVYSNVAGATGATYILKTADLGAHLRVVVTAINVAGVGTATSSPTALILPSISIGRKAAYPTEISWGQVSSGLFTFGVSTFGSTSDRLAAANWSSGFAGPYDQVTADVVSFQIQRGRDNDLTTMRAGTISITLKDHLGIYNPGNPSSPLAAFIDTDRPVRVSGQQPGGAAQPLFYGFISDIQADPSGRGSCVITAIDFLDKLDRQSPVLSGLPGNQMTGDILNAILDWFLWTDPTLRNIGVGDLIVEPYTLADGSRTGLSLTSDLLQSERGIVYIAKNGSVTYTPRLSRYIAASSGTIDKVMTAFPIGVSNANIVNQWTVARTNMAGDPVGIPQVYPDPTQPKTLSQTQRGIIAQTITTPLLGSDSQALGLAQYLYSRSSSGRSLVYEIPLNIADTATMGHVLARDLGDRITMTLQPRNMAAFTADFFIESINHSVTTRGAPRHACTWRVSAAPIGTPFRFGSSLMGGTDVLYY